MEQRIFHGAFSPVDLANSLIGHFDYGNLAVQKLTSGENVSVQIKTREGSSSGGETALGVVLQPAEDGVLVQVGQQAWAGIAASLGTTAITALLNPLNLLNRIDDIAQDFAYIQLADEVWKVLESTAKGLGSGYEITENLKRNKCEYCQTPNRTGEPICIACGAPLGFVQTQTCPHCGFVLEKKVTRCPNCSQYI